MVVSNSGILARGVFFSLHEKNIAAKQTAIYIDIEFFMVKFIYHNVEKKTNPLKP